MGRAFYLTLVWSPQDNAAKARAATLGARVAADTDWRRAGTTDRSIVWTGGAAPPAARALPLGAGFVVGDVFSAPGAPAGCSPLVETVAGRRPQAVAQQLSSAHWGRYVALLHGPPPCETAVFRDPSGHLDCLTWSLGDGLFVVASDPQAPPPYLRPPRLSLNWDRIGRYMAIPSADTTTPLFDGIDGVGPGDLRTVGAGQPTTLSIWSPATFANAETADPVAASEELVRRVDSSTAALTEGHGTLLMELSGGLDSAVVAAALAAAGRAPRVAQWLNRVGDRREGDEQAYARAVTDRLGVDLTATAKPRAPLTPEDLLEMSSTFWPSISASDVATDRNTVGRLRATGATGIVSGQGGDAVFFQMPSALVAADAFRRDGLATLWSPLLADVARRTRLSVWQVLAQVNAALRHRTPPLMPTFGLVSRAVAASATGAVHRWVILAREADVTPAKALQVEALANCHMFHSDSRRRREADLLYPLLAQPVVELCLSIGAPELAGGPFDRGFTREVFSDRLPELVRQRRTKGVMGSFFTHLVADSLEVFRPYLLDGCLCDAGVLDRAQVERLLDPSQLIWTSSATEILWAVTIEAWVRHWQARVPDSPAASRRMPTLFG